MFGDLKTPAGVKALNSFLADHSYIEGWAKKIFSRMSTSSSTLCQQVCTKPGWHTGLRSTWICTQGRSCPALVCRIWYYKLKIVRKQKYLAQVGHCILLQVQSHQVLRHRNEAVPQGQLRILPWWRSCSCRSRWRRWCRPLWIQVCGPEERWVINFTLVFSDEEESEEKKRITEERLKAYHEKKSKKAAVIAKTSVLLDVKVASNNITLDLLF